jgi:hypothetical protein
MCNCEDRPCCGCGDDRYDPEAEMERFLEARDAGDMSGEIEMEEDTDDDYGDEGPQMTDAEADADTLASAGWGTDEDYGYFGESGFYEE